MIQIVSKKVLALWPAGGLLQDDYFKRIRERAFRADPYSQKEESGHPKKTVLSPTGFGTNDRGHNPGAGVGLGRDENESKDKSLSSGYNDGGQAREETGPGQTVEPIDPYYTSDIYNELFLELKLKEKGTDNIKIDSNLKKLLEGPGMPTPHKRFRTGD